MQAPIDGSRRTTMAGGAFFAGLAGLGAVILRGSEAAYLGTAMPGDPGPFFVTRLCLWLIGISGVLLIAAGLLGREGPEAGFSRGRSLGEAARAWLLAAVFTLSLVAMPWAMRSFSTTEAVAVFSVPWVAVLLGIRDGTSWRLVPAALGFGIGAAVFIHIVFVRLLALPLPG